MVAPHLLTTRLSVFLQQGNSFFKKKSVSIRGILRFATTYAKARKETLKAERLSKCSCVNHEGRNFRIPQSTTPTESRWLCQLKENAILLNGYSLMMLLNTRTAGIYLSEKGLQMSGNQYATRSH